MYIKTISCKICIAMIFASLNKKKKLKKKKNHLKNYFAILGDEFWDRLFLCLISEYKRKLEFILINESIWFVLLFIHLFYLKSYFFSPQYFNFISKSIIDAEYYWCRIISWAKVHVAYIR